MLGRKQLLSCGGVDTVAYPMADGEVVFDPGNGGADEPGMLVEKCFSAAT